MERSVVPRPSLLLICTPLFGSVSGLATIMILYYLNWYGGFLPLITTRNGTITTPPISLLACQSPSHHRVYQVGFALTGVLLASSIQFGWKKHIRPFYFDSPSTTPTKWWVLLLWTMLTGGYLAVIGVIGQGLVTLDVDFWHNIHTKGKAGLTSEDVLHLHLATIFFIGAGIHCYVTTIVIWWSNRHFATTKTPPPGVVSSVTSTETSSSSTTTTTTTSTTTEFVATNYCTFSSISRSIKTACSIVSLLSWPIAAGLHPTRISDNIDGTIQQPSNIGNVGGAAQYIAVGSYILFFGSYSLDLWHLRRHHHQQQQYQHEQRHPKDMLSSSSKQD